MKKFFTIGLFCISSIPLFSQSSQILSPLIKEAKKSVLPIVCHDSTWKNNQFVFGTGVILGNIDKMVILTCEHVIAIKDSNNHTLRYISDIFVNVNDKSDSIVSRFIVDILYTNEKKDYALLVLSKRNKNYENAYFKQIQPSLWKINDDLTEGESVLYIGYPLLLGVKEINYPISRTGMICQISKNKNSFLIDGFVQHGHSGSPVFLLRPIPNVLPEKWTFSLIGIATSFPNEYNKILESVNMKEYPKTFSLSNPGFTYVTSMNDLIEILHTYGIK
jgi:hypothetical protein